MGTAQARDFIRDQLNQSAALSVVVKRPKELNREPERQASGDIGLHRRQVCLGGNFTIDQRTPFEPPQIAPLTQQLDFEAQLIARRYRLAEAGIVDAGKVIH